MLNSGRSKSNLMQKETDGNTELQNQVGSSRFRLSVIGDHDWISSGFDTWLKVSSQQSKFSIFLRNNGLFHYNIVNRY